MYAHKTLYFGKQKRTKFCETNTYHNMLLIAQDPKRDLLLERSNYTSAIKKDGVAFCISGFCRICGLWVYNSLSKSFVLLRTSAISIHTLMANLKLILSGHLILSQRTENSSKWPRALVCHFISAPYIT